MSPTLVPQTSSSDFRAFVSELGWHNAHRDPQNFSWRPDGEILRALWTVESRDANVAMRPEVPSRDMTFAPFVSGSLYAAPLPVRWTAARVESRPRPVPTTIVKMGKKTRVVQQVRGFDKLRLTPQHYQQIKLAHLRTARSDLRAKAYDRFQLLRQWEGEVVELDGTHFRAAVVTPDPGRRLRRECMRFPVSLVRPQDRDELVEGAFFYYCVGRFITRGQATAGSVLWFRRFLEDDRPVEVLMEAAAASSRIEWVS